MLEFTALDGSVLRVINTTFLVGSNSGLLEEQYSKELFEILSFLNKTAMYWSVLKMVLLAELYRSTLY